jgi:uncharacterized heparinase superfamily protein
VLRLLRMARYLGPEQVVVRAGFVLERRLAQARPGLLPRRYARRLARIEATTTDAPTIWRWPPAPLDPAARASPERAADILAGRFRFVGAEQTGPDWAASGTSRLYRFHLHSFGYAVDLAVAARRHNPEAYQRLRELVRSWLVAHPVGRGDAWHPFVVSARLSAWLVARDVLGPVVRQDAHFAVELRRAQLLHALFLADHLETDVGGNHLLKNGVALLLAGCAFDGPAAAAWRAQAARLLEAELPRQVRADGGHYERSPMYQLLVLEDLLAALFAAGRRQMALAVPLADAVRRMQRFAKTLVHPDGDIPLFNDAALGEAPSPERLLGPSTEALGNALVESGYFKLPVGPGAVMLADCGPPGPDLLPAHMHAGALGFELSVGGRRVLVDGGMDEYAAGPRRDLLRGTASHNTVQVEGMDQTEVFSSFRAGRRARVRIEWWEEWGAGATLVGSHTGYQRFAVRHERRIDAAAGVGWRVLDTLAGRRRHVAVARFRLHPTLRWRWPVEGEAQAVDDDGRVVLRLRPIGKVAVWTEAGLYAEHFGSVSQVDVLCLVWAAELPALFGAWLLLPGAEPVVV